MTITKLHSYQNGNCYTEIYSDGTKTREWEGKPSPIFPESLDVKITNYCDQNCSWCHEESHDYGRHANLNVEIFKGLPPGVEIAIGGGNPLSHPKLLNFLRDLKNLGLIANITLNENHISSYFNKISYMISTRLIHGIGFSYTGLDSIYRQRVEKLSHNIVYHFIAGIHNPKELLGVPKALILGYKKKGRGKINYSEKVEKNLYGWYTEIRQYFGIVPLSFDNLSLEQLKIRRFMSDEQWNKIYMGEEGQFSFFLDLVENEYAISSTSLKRYKINGNVIEMFKTFKEK